MTVEKQTFGAYPQQVAQIIDASIERAQPSDAEVRLRTEVSPGCTVSDSELLNGPETCQMRVPSFAETPFRFMGMTYDLGTLSERTLDLGMQEQLSDDLGRQEEPFDFSSQAEATLKCCTICRTTPFKCTDDVEDECTVCNEVSWFCTNAMRDQNLWWVMSPRGETISTRQWS